MPGSSLSSKPRLLRQRPRVTRSAIVLPIIAVGVLGLDLGRDLFAPLSLAAHVVGFTYGLAGLMCLAGALLLIIGPEKAAAGREAWLLVLWLTASSTTYICLTLALRSFSLEPGRAFGELALLALSLTVPARLARATAAGATPRSVASNRASHISSTRRFEDIPLVPRPSSHRSTGTTSSAPEEAQKATLPVNRSPLGRLRLSAAAVGALLTAVQFWYGSVYLPANAEVGFALHVAAASRATASPTRRLVPVEIQFQNQSSASAVALTSMFVVDGVIYPRGAPAWRSQPQILAVEPRIGLGRLSSEQDNIVALGDPARARNERLLAIGHLIADGRTLFPNVAHSTRLLIAVPPNAGALEIHVALSYTHSSQLLLADQQYTQGQVRRPFAAYLSRSCVWRPRAKDLSPFPVNLIEVRALYESVLQRITRGQEVLVTYWCYKPGHEQTFSFVARPPRNLQGTQPVDPPPAPPPPPAPTSLLTVGPGNANKYGIRHVTGVWTIPVPR